jgi:hypothetical protein
MASFDIDIHCATCDYNLKTLSPDSFCPECGSSVRVSLEACENAGFLHASHRVRAGRLLYAISIALACVSLTVLIEPLKQLSGDPFAGGATATIINYWGDKTTIFLAIITCCLLVRRLLTMSAPTAPTGRAPYRLSHVAAIGATTFTALLAASFATDVYTGIMGWRAFRDAVGPAFAGIARDFAWCATCAFQPLALAFLSYSALVFCAAVASRSGRRARAKRYAIAGGASGLLLLLFGLTGLTCSPKLDPVFMRVFTARMGKEILDEAEAPWPGADHRQAA